MRRVLALIAAIVLVAAFAGSAAATPAGPEGSSFVGKFEMINMDDGTASGWANVEIRVATEQRLAPGSYDFLGARGYSIREAHAVLGSSGFWLDSGHGADSHVAYFQGVECLYTDPGAQDCHAVTGMFVDVLDPTARDWVEFLRHDPNDTAQDPNDPETWTRSQFFVGKGAFVLNCVWTTCPTNP